MSTRSSVSSLLRRHGLRPNQRLGQHFLVDPNIVAKIVRTANLTASETVIEVGAGTGALTVALAAVSGHVIAYEVDESLRPALEETVGDLTNVELRFADVTKLDLAVAFGREATSLVANLPYNVGTGVVLDVLRQVPAITKLVVMVQREVADRFVADPGSKVYGVPSVIASLYADVSFEFAVPPQVFLPVPDVDSAVVSMNRRSVDTPQVVGIAVELAVQAFGQRRKMLRRSLSGVAVEADLLAAGLEPTDRAESVAPSGFVALAHVLQQQRLS